MVTKMGCIIRPYELNPGETDTVIEKSMNLLEDAFLGKLEKEAAVSKRMR